MPATVDTTITDRLPAPVLQLSPEGQIKYLNRAASKILGLPTDQLLQRNFFDRFNNGKHPDGALEDQELEITLHRDGHTRVLQAHVHRAVGESCSPGGYLIALCDITDWHQVNQERDRLMEMAAINEVMPSILHEFKNPLASIQAMVELLTEGCTDEALQRQLHSILMEIRRMNLSFEGLGSSTRNLRSTRCQAVDFGLREACLIFERRLEARGIDLKINIKTLPLLHFDCGGLRGILFNLINNARQACQSGDVIEVSAGLSNENRDFYFSVKDTGPGMSAETLAKCTNLFYTTKRMGSGIGLALCKSAVEKVGGRLEIESAPQEGCRITVTLPINIAGSH